MNNNFEPVMAALFSCLQAGGGSSGTEFLTTGRRLIPWSQVPEQPAMFLRRVGVTDEGHDPFTTTTLECEVWIYCNDGQDQDAIPDSGLTALEQMIRDSIAPGISDGDGRFTLGGLAYWCRIEGKSIVSPGDLDGQAIARIPIRITLP